MILNFLNMPIMQVKNFGKEIALEMCTKKKTRRFFYE